MKKSLGFLCGVFCAVLVAPAFGVVATNLGTSKTAYNGTGAISNNQWNTMMNARGDALPTNVSANFGNCNAAILRCASPKCSSGGCTDMAVARPIVAGCVNANSGCKKHGDDLIDYITAQIVAQSTAKVREQEQAVAIAQAQAEAAANAANAEATANAQMEQMQWQMQQMQSQMAESMNAMREQMAAQNESQAAQIQSALERQNSYSVPAAGAASGNDYDIASIEGFEGMSVAAQLGAKNGIDPNLLVREQMAGEVQTAVDDAMAQMKKLKTTLDAVLEYAGCDAAANNCTGPKRVKKFKELVNSFFDPYEGVLDSVYDALILASSVGIDINDAVMLLSGSCNLWGKYSCTRCNENCTGDDVVCSGKDADKICYYRVATDADGRVSKNQPHCRLVQTFKESDTVLREWNDPDAGMGGATQVACASDVIENLGVLRGRRKETSVGIEALRNLVAQDSSTGACGKKGETDYSKDTACNTAICTVNKESAGGFWQALQSAVRTKKLPDKWCSSKLDAFKGKGEQGTEVKDVAERDTAWVDRLYSSYDLTDTAKPCEYYTGGPCPQDRCQYNYKNDCVDKE